MKDHLKYLIEKHGKKHWSFAARKDVAFMDWVNAETADMPATTLFPIRVYCAVSGTRPLCENGNVRTELKNIEEGWRFCGKGNACQCAMESRSEKCKKIWDDMEPDRKSSIIANQRATLLDNHGVINAGRLPEAIAAHQAFYADPEKVALAVLRGKETMLSLYGVDNAFKLKKVDDIRRKLASTLTVEQRQEALRKRRVTLAKNGGTLRWSYERLVTKFTELGFDMLTPRSEYEGIYGVIDKRIKYEFRCHRCDLIFPDYIYDAHKPTCPICDKPKFNKRSMEQRSLEEYIDSLGISFISNTQKFIKKKEIDIQIPEKKVAIEYGGLYWHCETSNSKDKMYHLEKLRDVEAQGYRLITIFSDEWMLKRDLCKARIAHILGVSTAQKIYAKKTTVEKIDAKTARVFLDTHHMQGYGTSAKVHLGLFYEGLLVSVMTFGGIRYGERYIRNPADGYWELYRFASSANVVGGASKMFNAFIRAYDPKEVLSYCDRRWGNGQVYKNIGFVLEAETDPGYFWVDKYTLRYPRSKFTKKRLVAEGFDPNKTEVEIMQELKYDRIWDCGNLRFIWRK